MVKLDSLKGFVNRTADWPELAYLLDCLSAGSKKTIWDYPVLACEAVGGPDGAAEHIAQALFLNVLSIRLMDDILDEDPVGLQHRLGVNRTANLALALQALGALVLQTSPSPTARRIEQLYHQASLGTARGQDLDVQGAQDEAACWKIMEAKTAPLFASAFEMGALAGGASPDLAQDFARFGEAFAGFVQIGDDLSDAYESPARDDWKRPKNNLALLYATTVEHADQAAFLDLVTRVDDPEALLRAQEILTRSGALSYCVFSLIERLKRLTRIFSALKLKNPGPLREMLQEAAASIEYIFETAGVPRETVQSLMIP